MNQILYTEEAKRRGKGPVDIRKVVIFFVIAIILFAIILIGQGSYAMYKQNEEKKKNETIPTIDITKVEDEKQAKITINHDKAIANVIYKINDEDEKQLQVDGTNIIDKNIDLSVGTNYIEVTAIDINGKQQTSQTTIEVEEDLNIELSVIGNNIKIIASDTKEGMSYLTYKWNNEEEVRVDLQEDPYKIEVETQIPVGQNTLQINAVNKENIVKTKEQPVKGIKKPEVTAYQEGEYIVITVKDEEGIETIEHDLNGELLQTIEGGSQKELTYMQQIITGDNYVTVTVKSISGAETVFYGVCKN